jgi:hypothetical protein
MDLLTEIPWLIHDTPLASFKTSTIDHDRNFADGELRNFELQVDWNRLNI